VPNLIDLPDGCRFAPRCGARTQYDVRPATEIHPDLLTAGADHPVRCWLYHTSDQTPGWQPPLAGATQAAGVSD
jgi:hypothetical protein